MKLIVYTDGSSLHNPGDAFIGIQFFDEQRKLLEEFSWYIGKKTNNEAEYIAVYIALFKAREYHATEVDVYVDSFLVFQQLWGNWKIRKNELADIVKHIEKIIQISWISVRYHWIPREQNTGADSLARKAAKEKIYIPLDSFFIF